MYQQYFAAHPQASLGIVAMAIFVTLFVIVVVRAWRAPQTDIDARSVLPLTDAPPVTATAARKS